MLYSKFLFISITLLTLTGCITEADEVVKPNNQLGNQDSTKVDTISTEFNDTASLNDSTEIDPTIIDSVDCPEPIIEEPAEDTLWTPYDDSTLILDSLFDELVNQKKDETYLIEIISGICFGWCPNKSAKVYSDGLVIYEHASIKMSTLSKDSQIDSIAAAFYLSDSDLKQVNKLSLELDSFHKENTLSTDTQQTCSGSSDHPIETIQNGNNISYTYDSFCYESMGWGKAKAIYDELTTILNLQRFPTQWRTTTERTSSCYLNPKKGN